MIARYTNRSKGSTITLAHYKGASYAGLGHDTASADADCIKRIQNVWSVDGRAGLFGILSRDSALLPLVAPTATLPARAFADLVRVATI